MDKTCYSTLKYKYMFKKYVHEGRRNGLALILTIKSHTTSTREAAINFLPGLNLWQRPSLVPIQMHHYTIVAIWDYTAFNNFSIF